MKKKPLSKRIKAQIPHTLADTVQMFGFIIQNPIALSMPVPEKYPPTFVMTRKGLERGEDYYNRNKKRIDKNWGRL